MMRAAERVSLVTEGRLNGGGSDHSMYVPFGLWTRHEHSA